MTERETRDLARRLAEDSNIFDFDRALKIVREMPAEAERLIRLDEATARRQEERAHALKRLQRAIREEFG